MGRETKLLLGLLATLLGVFLGVLSMKLLVPRPPAGTGPDVHADVAAAEPQELVEPPRFDEPMPPASQAEFADTAAPPPQRPEQSPPRRFDTAAVARDPFVTRSSFTPGTVPTADSMPATPQPPAAFEPSALGAGVGSPTRAASSPPPIAGSAYVAREGDSWWSLAETVYGDGRLYRALFAWNRTVDPRVSLVPGTSLELPPLHRLQAAWPALMPAP
ncbi:MAG: LysM peptidoglycan-binding domain-containing protein [Planctomycetaceae bacterium]